MRHPVDAVVVQELAGVGLVQAHLRELTRMNVTVEKVLLNI